MALSKNCLFSVLAGVTLAAPLVTASVTLTDSTFNLGDYTVTTYNPNNVTVTQSQIATGGNPGSAHEIVYTYPASPNFSVRQFLINNTLSYNPSTQGLIAGLTVSQDHWVNSPQNPSGVSGGGFLLFQGGNYYIYGKTVPTAQATYVPVSTANLQASDWSLIVPASNTTDATQHPNFSATGGTILFGFTVPYILSAPGFGAGSATIRTDNLLFVVNPGTYYFPDWAYSGGYQTTLTYVNYSPNTVTCTTSFFSDSGTPVSMPFASGAATTRVDTLPPGGSVHDQTVANLAPPFVQGWAQASCSGPVEASMLFRLFQSGAAAGEASVNAETSATTAFSTFAQTATGIAYANPSTSQTASVTVTVYNTTGAALGTKTFTLAPLAHGAANVGPLVGLASFTGAVKVTSNIPIVALSLNAEAFPVFSSLPSGGIPAAPPSGTQTYYFSDLAFAGGYQTTLTFINYGSAAVTCTTNFYSNQGASLAIPFSQGTINTRTDALAPGGSLHDQTIANLSAAVTEGWAIATCTGPVQASLLYRLYNSSGQAAGEASVNAETAPTTSFATFAQAAAASTGIAYANPSTTQSASITIALYDPSGTKIGTNIITLAPLQHGSSNVNAINGSFTGFVKITATIPIVSLSLNAEAFPVFSSLPPGDLPASASLVP